MPKQTRPDDQKDIPANDPANNEDARDSVSHDRQSHIINQPAEDNARRTDADIDPVMPTDDSTLRTKI